MPPLTCEHTIDKQDSQRSETWSWKRFTDLLKDTQHSATRNEDRYRICALEHDLKAWKAAGFVLQQQHHKSKSNIIRKITTTL
ncbi:uncharacterized protein V6R79_004726 [Siganus canaliculatus]